MVFYKRHTAAGLFAVNGFTLVEAVVAVALIGVGVASTLGALTKFNSIAATSRNATGASAVLMNQVDLFQSMSPFNPQPSKLQIPKDTANTPPTYDMTAGAPGVAVTHIIGYQDPTTKLVIDPCSRPIGDQDTWPVYREPARWTYANAAARTGASGLAASDVGLLGYQSDDQTYWRLQSPAPTWTQDSTGGIIVKGTMTCTVTDVSTASMPNTYKAVFTLGYQYLGRGPVTNSTYKPCGSSASSSRSEYQLSMTVFRSSDI